MSGDDHPGRDRGGRRVLVADGSDTYRAVALRVLGDAGYRTAGAEDGLIALQAVADPARPVDLMVLELELPRLRGLDLLRRVREDPRLSALLAVVVSDALTEHLRRVLADLGVRATLTKNHALRELLYQVDSLLFPASADKRRAPRRLHSLAVNFWVGERLFLESCFDLSEEGMFITTADEEPPAVGTALELRFWLPTIERLIACEGEVVWINTARGDLRISHPPGMGVRFKVIASDDLALIGDFARARA